MKGSTAIIVVAVFLSIASFDNSFAQSEETTVIVSEELVHKVINGEFIVEREQVRMTKTSAPQSVSGSSEPDLRPWHEIHGYESKIHPSLQQEIDEEQKPCTYETTPGDYIVDDCPLDRNADGQAVLNVSILLQQVETWPNGSPDWTNMTEEEGRNMIDKRDAEIAPIHAASQQPVIDMLESNGQTVLKRGSLVNFIYADVTVDFLTQLVALDDVIFIESRNILFTTQILESKQITGIEQTKNVAGRGFNTVVGVIDTGIDIVRGSYNDSRKTATANHVDLKNVDNTATNKIKKISDLYAGDGNNPDDCNGHGTAVAGVISGTGAETFVNSGYAPQSQLNIYKVSTDCSILLDMPSIEAAIIQATQDGVDVINLSLITPDNMEMIHMALDKAFQNQIALVASTGNHGTHVRFPASDSRVLGVGASSSAEPNTRMFYSNFGSVDGRIKPDLVAPVDPSPTDASGMTTTTLGTNLYSSISGTSFASPQVSGAIADLISKYKARGVEMDPGRLYAIMLSQATGSATGSDGLRMNDQIGAGALNMRYNTLETRSGFAFFGVGTGLGATIQINVPTNAQKLTTALWWPENAEPTKDVELELRRGSTIVASSRADDTVSQRLIIDNPRTGLNAYDLRIKSSESFAGQTIYYSYTYTLPNSLPSISPRPSETMFRSLPGTSIDIPIMGNDTNLDLVTFFVSGNPDKGTISPTSAFNRYLPQTNLRAATLTYTSNPDATGIDSFSVTPWDGQSRGVPVPYTIDFSPEPPGPDVPDAVDDFAFTLIGNTIRFTWSHPNDGGSEITSYRIERLVLDRWQRHDVVSETTTSLDYLRHPGFSQFFRIFAMNEAGRSLPSDPLFVRIADDTPPDVRIDTRLDGTHIRIDTFEIFGNILEAQETPISNIQIRVNDVLNNDPIESTSTSTYITQWTSTITGLENGRHTITVSATNSDNLTGSSSITITVDIPTPAVLESFSDDFEDGLDKWLLSTERPQIYWTAMMPRTQVPDAPQDNMAAVGANCDNVCTMIMVDEVNLAGLTEPTLSFYRFVHSGADIRDAEGIIAYVSRDGGATWTVLESFLATTSDDDSQWHLEEYSLGSYARDTIKLRFDAITSTTFEAMALDDVRIFDKSTPEPLVITPPAALTIEATAVLTPVELGSATVSRDATITNNAPGAYPLGETVVEWTATDDASNTVTATQVVTIQDTTNPVFTSTPPDVSRMSDVPISIDFDMPEATDIFPVTVTCNPDSGSTFQVGTATVTCTATDSSGNTAQTSFDVTVTIPEDSTPPVIIAPSDVTVEATAVQTPVNLGTPDVTDNADSSPTYTNDAPESFGLGTMTVTWTARDSSDNTATDTQLVTVRDTTSPVFTSTAQDIMRTSDVPLIVNYDKPAATDIFPVTVTCDLESGYAFQVGTTIVTCTATDDNGNTAQTSFQITVQLPADTTPPEITAPADIVLEATAVSTPVDLGTPIVSDNRDPNPTRENNAPRSFVIGATTVTWAAIDSSGNTAVDIQLVTVQDTTRPVFTGTPPDITHTSSVPLAINYNKPEATDIFPVTVICDHDSGGTFPVRGTIVTCTATDDNGNTAQTSFDVTIRIPEDTGSPDDTVPPRITVPLDITVDATAEFTPVFLGTPVATDNMDPHPLVTNDAPDLFPVGTIRVVWTVTDSSGNFAKDVQLVTVRGPVPGLVTDFAGGEGDGPGQFRAPVGIDAVDGRIYVTDHVTNKVQEFSDDGLLVRKIGGSRVLSDPVSVALDPTRVFVADRGNHLIQVFNHHGRLLGAIGSQGTAAGQLDSPTAVDAANGMLYVADRGNHRIQVFEPGGTFVRQFGADLRTDGKPMWPIGIVANSTHVLVSDRNDHTVKIFTTDGRHTGTIGERGGGPGQFKLPYGLELYEDRIYVADRNNHRIQVFDSSGTYVEQYGEFGTDPDQFDRPQDIAIYEDIIYVADSRNHRVQFIALPTELASGDG